MDSNKLTSIIFLLSIPISFASVITANVPPEYAALTVALLGVLSEIVNYLKGGLNTAEDVQQVTE